MTASAALPTAASVPVLPRGVRLHFDRVRDAHVLLAPERAFAIDANAVAVLQRVDGRRTIGTIVAELAAVYATDPDVVARDVIAMIGDLAGKRVIELA